MPNHFHINIVDEEENTVRGIALCFIENINNKKSLVLRGFNPSLTYLKKISAESFVENILNVARKFKTDNNLEHIYLVNEGIGNALSNREQIKAYFNKKYLPKLVSVEHTMNVSGNSVAKNVLLLE